MTFGTLSVTDLGAYFLFVNIFLFRYFTSYILSFLPFLLPLRVAIFTLMDYHFFLWGLPFFALGSVSFFHIAKLHILSRSCKLFRQISTQKSTLSPDVGWRVSLSWLTPFRRTGGLSLCAFYYNHGQNRMSRLMFGKKDIVLHHNSMKSSLVL